MIKFMNTKNRCLDCGEKLRENIIKNKNEEKFCSNWCKDNWEIDTQ